MKASELIKKLTELVEEKGDKNILLDDGNSPFLTILNIKYEEFIQFRNGVIVLELVEHEY